jgi:predicted secreted protein
MVAATVSPGTAFKGRKAKVRWKGEYLLGVRTKTLTVAGEPVNVTDDDDDGWRKLADNNGAAEDTVEITVQGIAKDSQLLDDFVRRNRTGTLMWELPTGETMTGTFVLTSFSQTGAYNDAMTYEATFQNSGPVTFDYQFS